MSSAGKLSVGAGETARTHSHDGDGFMLNALAVW